MSEPTFRELIGEEQRRSGLIRSASPSPRRTSSAPGPRRSQEPGNHQLPHVQAGEGRPFLRAHLRPDPRLGMLLRQIQAHQAQGRHLRSLRRRSDARPRAPRAHGPHRAGRAGHAHLVLQVHAVAHRPDARHDEPPARARHLLRGLHRHRSGQDAAAASASS